MKIKNILTLLVAVCALAIGCTKKHAQQLENIQVSASTIGLKGDGTQTQIITVTANAEWKFETEIPSWLVVTPVEGGAGTTEVTFKAAAESASCNKATLKISCGGQTQYIMVQQGVGASINTAETAFTADEAIAYFLEHGAGAEIYVKGLVKSSSIDTGYGNAEFYLYENSAEYDFELYRCYDFDGEKFTDANKVKAGDTVVAYGALTKYNSVIELAQGCKLIKLTKSELELKNAEELSLGKEGGSVTAKFVVNGGDLNFSIKDDFLSVKEIVKIPAVTNDKGKELEPAMTGVVISATANDGGAREGSIEFQSGNSKLVATVSQEGAISDVTVEQFLEKEDGTAIYRLSGFITNRTDLGHKFDLVNYGNFDVTDATGNAYVYGVGSKGDIATYGVKEGDIITLEGQHGSYNGDPQMAKAQYVSHKSVTPVKASEIPAMADDNKDDPQNYIRLTGVVTNDTAVNSGHKFDIEKYGNFALVDNSGSVYVYGVTTGWKGEAQKFASLGVKEGDTITIVAYKTSYKGDAQVVGMYVSHISK